MPATAAQKATKERAPAREPGVTAEHARARSLFGAAALRLLRPTSRLRNNVAASDAAVVKRGTTRTDCRTVRRP
jgi:hypothetical protein